MPQLTSEELHAILSSNQQGLVQALNHQHQTTRDAIQGLQQHLIQPVRVNLPDRDSKIPYWDGNKNTLLKWILAVQDAFTDRHLADTDKVARALTHMNDYARTIHELTLADELNTWDTFRRAVISAFLPHDYTRYIEKELQELKMQGNFSHYTTNFLSYRKFLEDIPELRTITLFIDGLDPYIQQPLRQNPPATLRATVEAARRIANGERPPWMLEMDTLRQQLLATQAYITQSTLSHAFNQPTTHAHSQPTSHPAIAAQPTLSTPMNLDTMGTNYNRQPTIGPLVFPQPHTMAHLAHQPMPPIPQPTFTQPTPLPTNFHPTFNHAAIQPTYPSHNQYQHRSQTPPRSNSPTNRSRYPERPRSPSPHPHYAVTPHSRHDTSEPIPRCYSCGLHGHIRQYCPHILCYACGRLGHEARDCPEARYRKYPTPPRRCRNCGSTNHTTNDCRRSPRRERTPDRDAERHYTRSPTPPHRREYRDTRDSRDNQSTHNQPEAAYNRDSRDRRDPRDRRDSRDPQPTYRDNRDTAYRSPSPHDRSTAYTGRQPSPGRRSTDQQDPGKAKGV